MRLHPRGSADDQHRVVEHLPHPVDRRDRHRRTVGIAPLIGHQHHPVSPAPMRGIVVGGVQQALLVGALLGRDGRRQIPAALVQQFGQAAQELVVAFPVEGIDVLDVQIDPGVAAAGQGGKDVLHRGVLHGLVGKDRVSDVAGKAAALAEIRHGQKGSDVLCQRRLDETAVVNGHQLAVERQAVGKGAEKAEVWQRLIQRRVGNARVGIGVDQDLLPVRLLRPGHEQSHVRDQAGRVIELIEIGQMIRGRAGPPGDTVERVSGFYNINIHHCPPLASFFIYIRRKKGIDREQAVW